ncbi:MAG: AAA family ATPase [Dysgonamonadaceae bacterium]|jgi:predicted ATPase|nr:AAA family ATPase [Dysgonamonadaceae bacterium]
MITKFHAENFTAFKELAIDFSPGINIFIGENGTGKTHVMKALYSACSIIDTRGERDFVQKLKSVFLPNTIGRLVRRTVGRSSGSIEVFRKDAGDKTERYIKCRLTTLNKTECTLRRWNEDRRSFVTYIPVKDMLANAPGFRSLYAEKHIHFEEIYSDIIDKALLPASRGKQTPERSNLTKILSSVISGRVIEKNEQFYLKNKSGELEFTLLAEGFRKLGLLYLLIRNETLMNGSILFWDEPEANLNPKLAKTVVKILIELQKMGVQIFIATHDYVFLKEFDLAISEEDNILYHSLFYDSEEEIAHAFFPDFDDLTPNVIDDTFDDILDREIQNKIK